MSGVQPGDVIAGKFAIERLLGEGGMGYVVAARHLQLGQTVALKFMREEVCTPEFKSRFHREARNLVRLKSKHVSRVLDVGTLDSGAPYMVMEYLEGTDLSDLLHRQGPIPVQLACDYVIQACEAIYEAHGLGIIHRDLKPANLFLTSGTSGEAVVKVLDFGVSKVLDLSVDDETNLGGRPRINTQEHQSDDSVVTKASDLLGSPNYMAPEQIVSARDAKAASDIWSLGVILFRLVSGKAPFNGSVLGELIQAIVHGPIPNLRAVRPDLPPGLENVVARCLERDPHRRLSDAGELARLLAPYAGPVATPSLERIAILGSALVTTAPAPQPSARSPVSTANAWTMPPGSVATSPGEAAAAVEATSAGVYAWFALATVVVGVLAFGLVTAATHNYGPEPLSPSNPPAQGASPFPPPPPPRTARPGDPSTLPVSMTSMPPSVPSPSPLPVATPSGRTPANPARATHGARPSGADHKSGRDIPRRPD